MKRTRYKANLQYTLSKYAKLKLKIEKPMLKLREACLLLGAPHDANWYAWAADYMIRNKEEIENLVALRPIKRGRKMSKSFYKSDAWMRLRYLVLKESGARCQCCGASGRVHVDHIKPRSIYPELELARSNLQVLCEACNLGKSNLDQTDWRPRVVG